MFPDLIDLASELVGGVAFDASDEFFAPKENLLRASEPVFVPDKYTEQGKWMDGWESRRKRVAGHDWCAIRLGLPGLIRTVDVDTRHFLGNYPSHCSLDWSETTDSSEPDWKPLLGRVRLQGGGHNLFDIENSPRVTHVRINIFPDGGVARLRLFGDALPDIRLSNSGETADFASVMNGGRVVASSDSFFGHQQNLIMPGRPVNMGGGWETRRRRGPGYDWIIVHLGGRISIERIAVETEHYKGNYPDACSIDVCEGLPAIAEDLITGRVQWREILPLSKLKADVVRMFSSELVKPGLANLVRLNIYPDGGISRLRVFGKIVE